jgi:hypothetical protein
MKPTPTRSARLHRLAFLFPLVLWGLATLYFGGDIGRWKDDYWLDFRDPATGEADLSASRLMPANRTRPLYHIITPALHQVFGSHFWVVHIVSAAVHGLVTLVLWRLLLALGAGRRVAAGAALLFMVYPGAWEIALWPTAMATGLATALFLVMALMWAQASRGDATGLWPRLRRIMPPLVVIAFAIPCLNEQPATAILALPLLSLAAAGPGADPRRIMAHSAIPAAACLGMVALYLAIYMPFAPHGVRGTAGTFVSDLEQMRRHCAEFVRQFRFHFLVDGLGRGSLIMGFRTLLDGPALALCWLGALAGAAWPWLAWFRSPAAERPAADREGAAEDRPSASGTSLMPVAFGLAVFILGWLPVLAIRVQGIEPQLCYVPALGLTIALACAVRWVAARVRARPFGRDEGVPAAAILLVMLPLLLGALMMVGIQTGLRARWRMDQRQAVELRMLLPEPIPGTMFVPLRLSDNFDTGIATFDRFFSGALDFPWSATPYVRGVYGRRDVRSTWWQRNAGWTPVKGGEARGLRFDDRIMHPFDRLKAALPVDDSGATLIPWGRAVPLVVDEDGQVRLISAVVVFDTWGGRTVYPVFQAARALGAGGKDGAWAVFREGAYPMDFELQDAPPPSPGPAR